VEQQEQNRSEEATPFKLRRAREKGQVARGMDLGFVGSLLALAAMAAISGPAYIAQLAEVMKLSLTGGIGRTGEPSAALATVAAAYWPAIAPLLQLGATIIVLLVFLELLQLRGLVFTAEPLKPDFSRLNPAKGLKRLFSLRMVKETLKNIFKMAIYTGLAWLMISGAVAMFGDTLADANALGRAMASGAKRLLLAFICAAFFFMVLDQLIVRGEFRKQMRMSRREVTREAREREGEPRLKQRRRQLHQEMRKQSEGLGKLDGSDFIVTNPDHFAIALAYDPAKMDAPMVRARGRNHFAQLLKRKARLLGLPVIADPALARALYRECRADAPIGPQHFHAVARHYAALRRQAKGREGETGIELDG
jgi:flagellar biosynthetic protein FlhB